MFLVYFLFFIFFTWPKIIMNLSLIHRTNLFTLLFSYHCLILSLIVLELPVALNLRKLSVLTSVHCFLTPVHLWIYSNIEYFLFYLWRQLFYFFTYWFILMSFFSVISGLYNKHVWRLRCVRVKMTSAFSKLPNTKDVTLN